MKLIIRYFTVDDGLIEETPNAITIYESETDAKYHLLDQYGNPLYRKVRRNQIGFDVSGKGVK